MANQMYPPELIKPTPFLDLHLAIANRFVSSKICDRRDDFDFLCKFFRFWTVTFLAVLPMVYMFCAEYESVQNTHFDNK